ncbi:MAG: S1C family serine protease [Defluviitaleaceae bacterium]|nr:S1C family serine protease [Defluviitaleaceae bacterium]MCL2274765.1 S1C family serine protease [Defluviitaleaceae bacterium]
MQDAPNKKDDLYSITEIEKIQAEIARDLALADSIVITPTPITTPPPATTVYNSPYTAPVTPAPIAPISARSTPQVSWIKRLVLVCIICTLGTTSFGFAFGAAATWIRSRANDAPTAPLSGEASASLITSSRYAFEPLPDGTAATLADMISAAAASVVGIATINNDMSRQNGTGVIFAEEEERVFIVTNHYVVYGGQQVLVRFTRDVAVEAHPFAHDQEMDISVIFVYKADLASAGIHHVVLATFGDSSAMRMGDTVIALGNSRGEGISVTRGIISTEEQLIQIPSHVIGRTLDVYVIQTDASINDGDSGGPLINTRGEVIGIINANVSFVIFDTGAMAEGIGYSIASNTVQEMVYLLVNRLRPAIGITGTRISDAQAERWDIPRAGVYVSRVMANGAAEAAGVQDGDIITGFNGQPVIDMDQLRADISVLRPGDVVEVRILRNGNPLVLEMTLQPMIFDTF